MDHSHSSNNYQYHTAAATPSQSWGILHRHAREDITPLRLHELCHDTDRVSSLVAVHTSEYDSNEQHDGGGSGYGGSHILLADLSRQRMTLDTLNHLLRLASARDIRGYIRRLAWGQNDPDHPIIAERPMEDANNNNNGDDDDGRSSSSPSLRRSVPPSRSSSHITNPPAQPLSTSHNPPNPCPSMHMSLRAPPHRQLEMLTLDGTNALDGVHREWKRMERLSEHIRTGQVRGATGCQLRDVVVVGRGVAVMALRFMYEALRRDYEAERGSVRWNPSEQQRGKKDDRMKGANLWRKMRFVNGVDPTACRSALAGLRPESTLIISIVMQGNEEMTGVASRTVRNWLLAGLSPSSSSGTSNSNSVSVSSTGGNSLGGTTTSRQQQLKDKKGHHITSKHMVLVTSNDRLGKNHTESGSVFVLPEHSRCEAFTTFTAAGLLPLSIVFGWRIVEKILAGAHDMDKHFVETNPRHNLPILLALTDVWNDAFLKSSGRVITPFSEPFKAYPSFVAALESQTCGRGYRSNSPDGQGAAAAVIDNFGGAYDRLLYQGRIVPSELITAMDTQAKIGVDGDDVIGEHDGLMCGFFAHADVLAFGSGSTRQGGAGPNPKVSPGGDGSEQGSFMRSDSNVSSSPALLSYNKNIDYDYGEGNRPSTLLLCGRCDAFTCGQLVALSEHRAVVAARLWDVDPFVKKVGSSLRTAETERLREKLQRIYDRMSHAHSFAEEDEEDDDDDEEDGGGKINLATRTILGHYARRMQDLKTFRPDYINCDCVDVFVPQPCWCCEDLPDAYCHDCHR